jgi:RNA polymerase sigma-70 factor, ECF subfamily
MTCAFRIENMKAQPFAMLPLSKLTGRSNDKQKPMLRFKTSRKEDFATVVERELDTLYRVAKRLTRNESDAEDTVSQTLTSAFQSWDRFDGKHTRSWLITILRNEWLQILRKRKSRPEVAIDLVAEPFEECSWKEVDTKILAQQIKLALAQIPEEYRLAVELCDVEGLSYEEAAAMLGVPIGTIRSRLFRGRNQLREKLTGLMEDNQ